MTRPTGCNTCGWPTHDKANELRTCGWPAHDKSNNTDDRAGEPSVGRGLLDDPRRGSDDPETLHKPCVSKCAT